MSSTGGRARTLVLVALVGAATLAAQRVAPQFAIGLGMTAPTGDYHADQSGDGFDVGWQVMGVMTYRKPGRPVGIRVNAGYGENGGNGQLNADLTSFVGQPTTAAIRMLGGDVDVTYNLKRSRRGTAGYLLGGIGAYRASFAVTSGGVTADTSETRFAWNVGGGLAIPAGSNAVFLEIRYWDVSKAFDISRLASVALMAGFRFGGS